MRASVVLALPPSSRVDARASPRRFLSPAPGREGGVARSRKELARWVACWEKPTGTFPGRVDLKLGESRHCWSHRCGNKGWVKLWGGL
uniref:ZFP62 zinc finger protein n=1 Tax=Myotis myotis TaxID=51298 RepID=A0A7J7XLR7_MYOMY|nr:ZFP62 zinc finger protein [Myotis myotis]